MIAYVSRPTSIDAKRLCRAYGWRVLLSPGNAWACDGFRYALDNGAWGAYKRGEDWDSAPFMDLLKDRGPGADWVVLPDIVGGGLESLSRSLKWRPTVALRAKLYLLPVQDGMVVGDVLPHLKNARGQMGLFVGGTTDWKLRTLRTWCALSSAGYWVHVGRVNSVRRVNLCLAAGATSFDGSGPARFTYMFHKLDAARRQRILEI